MKNTYFLLFLLGTAVGEAQSYTPFINHESIWIVREYNRDSTELNYLAFRFGEEVEIDCQPEVFTTLDRYKVDKLSSDAIIELDSHPEVFLREDLEERKVYSTEPHPLCETPPWPVFVLFDFGLTIGDSVYIGSTENEIVDDRFSTFFGYQRRYLRTTDPDEDFGVYIEGIGSLSGYLSKYKIYGSKGRKLINYCEGGTIRECLKGIVDRSMIISSTSSEYSDISMYPNPVSSILRFEGVEDQNFAIFDNLGRKCMEGMMLNEEIDVGKLSKGQYFITLSSNLKGNFIKK